MKRGRDTQSQACITLIILIIDLGILAAKIENHDVDYSVIFLPTSLHLLVLALPEA